MGSRHIANTETRQDSGRIEMKKRFARHDVVAVGTVVPTRSSFRKLFQEKTCCFPLAQISADMGKYKAQNGCRSGYF